MHKRFRAVEDDSDPARRMRAVMNERQLSDYRVGMMLALIHVFAVPRYSALLSRSGAYRRDPIARHQVTVDLLSTVISSGFDSATATAAIRRMNHAHQHAGLTRDDMRFALAAFVVIPRWWAAHVLDRPWSDEKTSAVIAFFVRLGELSGVEDLPPSLRELSRLVEDFEKANVGYARTNEAMLDSALDHLTRRWPATLRGQARATVATLLDDRLRGAFGLPAPSPTRVLAAQMALRTHNRLAVRLPKITIRWNDDRGGRA